MACEAFMTNDFRGKSLAVIEKANAIIEAYQAQGFTLTLRQLYYQFVARDLIPNQQSEYKKLGAILNKARLCGLVDWNSIEDRTRNMRRLSTWDSPEDIMRSAAYGYREDIWATQPRYVVVLEEKDALLGVIEPICNELRVPFMSCRGNVSQSEMYVLGKRLAEEIGEGRDPLVLYLGDHDPSGVDMTRDVQRRLSMFSEQEIDVNRLALNMDQIRRYRPPPNPAKETDSRHGAYVRTYGTNQSWELDALEPTVIAELIREAVVEASDEDAWKTALAREDAHQEALKGIMHDFDEVARYLKYKDHEHPNTGLWPSTFLSEVADHYEGEE